MFHSLPKQQSSSSSASALGFPRPKMHLKGFARSLSFRRSGSSRYVESSILADSLTSQSMRLTKYENLSKSIRMEGFVIDERSGSYGDFGEAPRSDSFRWMSKLRSISLNGIRSNRFGSVDVCREKQIKSAPTNVVMKEEKLKVKKKSSWLPDRKRRWPLQGW